MHAGMPCILDAQQVTTLLNVIRAAKEDVDLLKRDLARLGDEEVHEERKADVDGEEEEEAVEALLVQECWEELLHNGVCDVLCLRRHADGLRSNVHGEDFRRPDPRRCAYMKITN